MWQEALIWLFVINLGIAFGAGVYEARVVIPQWTGIPPPQWPSTGVMFWVYVTTVPLTLLTIANLVSGWFGCGRVRRWQLAAGLIVLAERILTFSYFIPTMVGLMQSEGLPASEDPRGPLAMACFEPYATCHHVRRVARSAEGVVIAQSR